MMVARSSQIKRRLAVLLISMVMVMLGPSTHAFPSPLHSNPITKTHPGYIVVFFDADMDGESERAT